MRGKAEDADGLTLDKDDHTAVGGSAAGKLLAILTQNPKMFLFGLILFPNGVAKQVLRLLK